MLFKSLKLLKAFTELNLAVEIVFPFQKLGFVGENFNFKNKIKFIGLHVECAASVANELIQLSVHTLVPGRSWAEASDQTFFSSLFSFSNSIQSAAYLFFF